MLFALGSVKLRAARSAIAEKSNIVLAVLLQEMLRDALEVIRVWGAVQTFGSGQDAQPLPIAPAKLLRQTPNPILLSRFKPVAFDFAEFTKTFATSLSKRGKCIHNLLASASKTN